MPFTPGSSSMNMPGSWPSNGEHDQVNPNMSDDAPAPFSIYQMQEREGREMVYPRMPYTVGIYSRAQAVAQYIDRLAAEGAPPAKKSPPKVRFEPIPVPYSGTSPPALSRASHMRPMELNTSEEQYSLHDEQLQDQQDHEQGTPQFDFKQAETQRIPQHQEQEVKARELLKKQEEKRILLEKRLLAERIEQARQRQIQEREDRRQQALKNYLEEQRLAREQKEQEQWDNEERERLEEQDYQRRYQELEQLRIFLEHEKRERFEREMLQQEELDSQRRSQELGQLRLMLEREEHERFLEECKREREQRERLQRSNTTQAIPFPCFVSYQRVPEKRVPDERARTHVEPQFPPAYLHNADLAHSSGDKGKFAQDMAHVGHAEKQRDVDMETKNAMKQELHRVYATHVKEKKERLHANAEVLNDAKQQKVNGKAKTEPRRERGKERDPLAKAREIRAEKKRKDEQPRDRTQHADKWDEWLAEAARERAQKISDTEKILQLASAEASKRRGENVKTARMQEGKSAKPIQGPATSPSQVLVQQTKTTEKGRGVQSDTPAPELESETSQTVKEDDVLDSEATLADSLSSSSSSLVVEVSDTDLSETQDANTNVEVKPAVKVSKEVTHVEAEPKVSTAATAVVYEMEAAMKDIDLHSQEDALEWEQVNGDEQIADEWEVLSERDGEEST
ncbi:hypothetical protein P280DRAFT_548250 [Massarina eburnea CBS 473.64]|uniref:Uncharacterized protein n=1 Tax=Massarina eburnea CBS 473.64 TaxID=1395130 RepID=A0A6A6S4K3_9PLEO|nr:hypothetical protein P280DRAFT_548250 [Massarina eburnea CBS 473.64]